MDSLNNNYNKLFNAKKPTGDPSCPLHLCRAKHIAHNIQIKIAPKLVGDEDTNSEVNKEPIDIGIERDAKETEISAQVQLRQIAQTGIYAKKPKTEKIITSGI